MNKAEEYGAVATDTDLEARTQEYRDYNFHNLPAETDVRQGNEVLLGAYDAGAEAHTPSDRVFSRMSNAGLARTLRYHADENGQHENGYPPQRGHPAGTGLRRRRGGPLPEGTPRHRLQPVRENRRGASRA